MKKIMLFLACTFTCLTGAFAQATLHSAYEIKHAFDFYQHNGSKAELLNPTLSADDVKGSPYFNDEFIKGTLFTTSKTQFVDIPLRYNIYNDQVEFMNADGKAYAIAVPEIIETIDFGDYQMEYILYQDAKKMARGFFIVQEKGDASLYSRQNVMLQQAKKAAAYQEPQPPRFIKRPAEYYIRVGMEPAKPVSKKKDLQEVFIQKNDDINAYIKKNNVKINDPASLKELVKYYNTL